jgi:hypothetical protein
MTTSTFAEGTPGTVARGYAADATAGRQQRAHRADARTRVVGEQVEQLGGAAHLGVGHHRVVEHDADR